MYAVAYIRYISFVLRTASSDQLLRVAGLSFFASPSHTHTRWIQRLFVIVCDARCKRLLAWRHGDALIGYLPTEDCISFSVVCGRGLNGGASKIRTSTAKRGGFSGEREIQGEDLGWLWYVMEHGPTPMAPPLCPRRFLQPHPIPSANT